ncbi:MAG: hypothetical protein AAF492_00895 [Verrucomicrobiota bacterium]
MRKAAYLMSVVFCIVLFLWGAARQAERNTDRHAADQSAYLHYAQQLRTHGFDYAAPRSRMPLFPALLALFHQPDSPETVFFRTGQRIGVLVALAVLVMAYAVFRRAAEPFDALVATLVAAFTVFAYKAPWVQAELLYYGLGLIGFALIFDFLRSPRPLIGAAAGFAAGLAYLTKAAFLPTVAIGLLFAGVRTLAGPPGERLKAAAGTGLLALSFLVTVSPYILESKARFGQYFYNVNSAHYMWCDSWDEIEARVKVHKAAWQSPDVPAPPLPSLTTYLDEHTFGQIMGRLIHGFRITWRTAWASYGYMIFVTVYALGLGLFAARHRFFPGRWNRIRCIQAAFSVSLFGAYALLFAWFTPLSSGNRFGLALFLPFLYLCLSLIGWARRNAPEPGLAGLPRIVAGSLAIYLLAVFPFRIGQIMGGT